MPDTLREKVQRVCAQAETPLPGAEVAKRVHAPYKPTIDALNALHDMGRVGRQGHKKTARWTRVPCHHTTNPAAKVLEGFFQRVIA